MMAGTDATQGGDQSAWQRRDPAKAFAAGLAPEVDPIGGMLTASPLPEADEKVRHLIDKLKRKVIEVSKIHDADYVEPTGLRFSMLKIWDDSWTVGAEQLLAHLRADPHLDKDHLLRVAKDPDSDSWILCVVPRHRLTKDGAIYWLSSETLEEDRIALEGLCLDLRDTRLGLQVWAPLNIFSEAPAEAREKKMAKIRDIFSKLQKQVPKDGTGEHELKLMVPTEAGGQLPFARPKEDYVVLNPITDKNPHEQEDHELREFEEKLAELRRSDKQAGRKVSLIIRRHTLTTRIVSELNKLRAKPEHEGLFTIMARDEIRRQYPELFKPVDTRRPIQRVALEDLPKPLPQKAPEKNERWRAPATGEAVPVESVAKTEPVGDRFGVTAIRDLVAEIKWSERARRHSKKRFDWLKPSGWFRRKK